MIYKFCDACAQVEVLDAEWRVLWADKDGALHVSLRLGDLERQVEPTNVAIGPALACGQSAVLKLVERYLDKGTFDAPITAALRAHNATITAALRAQNV